ncbi:MAG TPA: protein kinase [Gemmatimonadaceae bacterium]|nr:protein kinase [Gemmatimonadaceae bacterium]
MQNQLDRLREALGKSYQLEGMVGSGGMASVYRAVDVRHNRTVAVKVLHPDLASSVSFDRFSAEVLLTASLQHPHILPLHDSGGEGDLLFYVMPFVEGAQTLRTRIQDAGRLPIDEAVEVALVVGGALEYAHKRGVIHRDIKPENILLSNGVAMVADFGIARVVEAAGGKGMTSTGVSIGTPSYMSPEQAVGDPSTDARTDIYALGAVLFEMLAGQPPFGGGTSVAIMKKLFTEPAPSLDDIRPDVPPAVSSAVARALEKEPDERFPTAREFVATLRGGRRDTPAQPIASSGQTRVKVEAVESVETTERSIPSLAILPLANIGGDTELDYFCDGMTEELISTLSRLPGVRVASRTSAFALQARSATVEEIAQVLKVDYVLEGSVRRSGDRLRVGAQLVEVATQRQYWSDRFDRAFTDVFDLQDELATTIADALSVRLLTSAGERVGGIRRGTDNLAAYQLVLRGRYFWNQRALDKAMQSFQEAVALDPAYAQAWAGLADGFSFLGYYGALSPRLAFDRGRAAAERAVSADPGLPEAHYARGLFELLLGHDIELAGRSLQRAVELGPRLGSPRATFSQWLALTGDRDESHAQAEAALALEPLSPLIAATVAWAAVMGGEPERAEQLARQGLELAPDSLPCMWTMGGALLELGKTSESVEWLQRSVERSGRLPYMVALHAHAAAVSGDVATARASLQEISHRPDGPRPGLSAWIHLGLGDMDTAMALFLEAAREHDPHALEPLVIPRSGRPAVRDQRYAAALESSGLGALHRARARRLA